MEKKIRKKNDWKKYVRTSNNNVTTNSANVSKDDIKNIVDHIVKRYKKHDEQKEKKEKK